MPTYDYECQSCGHVFEYFQSMSDEPLSECPKCGKGVKRLIGGGMGIIFKGSGFYVTDNRSASRGGGSSSGGSGASESGSPAKEKSTPAGAGSTSGTSSNSSGGTNSGKSSGTKESA